MIEWYLRPVYQRWCVEPLTRYLYRGALSAPGLFTLLAVVFGLLTAAALWQQHPFLGCLCLWLSGYCDTLDGSLARSGGSVSARGAVLDIIADRIVECLVIVGLYSVSPSTRGAAVMAILISNLLCITVFLVVGIFVKNNGVKSFYYSRGWIERPEAFGFYTVMILLPSIFLVTAWVYITLVLLTALQHFSRFFYDEEFNS